VKEADVQRLFAYGTLQHGDVQHATFGRVLEGRPDALPGFEQTMVRIDDPAAATALGEEYHVSVAFNGNPDSRVNGVVLEVTSADLAVADAYEQEASYRRILAQLASGTHAWVYLHASAKAGD
jgi:gamma-glutamylcyclotransferase (GGCT)/AIG2-like uncharacterized protein YtfP